MNGEAFKGGTLSFTKKKKRGQAEKRESDKCGFLHTVTNLFGLLIAPPRHLAESENRWYLARWTF